MERDEPARWRASYTEEDRRWERRAQLRDWLVLAAMIAIVVGYHLAIFFLEPGLRNAG